MFSIYEVYIANSFLLVSKPLAKHDYSNRNLIGGFVLMWKIQLQAQDRQNSTFWTVGKLCMSSPPDQLTGNGLNIENHACSSSGLLLIPRQTSASWPFPCFSSTWNIFHPTISLSTKCNLETLLWNFPWVWPAVQTLEKGWILLSLLKLIVDGTVC